MTEKWLPQTKRRVDLFGYADIVAVADEIIAIQCTSTSNMSARVKKIQTDCRDAAIAWLKAGGKILVIGWKKYAQPVERRYYRERVQEITLEDLGVKDDTKRRDGPPLSAVGERKLAPRRQSAAGGRGRLGRVPVGLQSRLF